VSEVLSVILKITNRYFIGSRLNCLMSYFVLLIHSKRIYITFPGRLSDFRVVFKAAIEISEDQVF
jgi:hypothetical protein